jgi:hypothetical protein
VVSKQLAARRAAFDGARPSVAVPGAARLQGPLRPNIIDLGVVPPAQHLSMHREQLFAFLWKCLATKPRLAFTVKLSRLSPSAIGGGGAACAAWWDVTSIDCARGP